MRRISSSDYRVNPVTGIYSTGRKQEKRGPVRLENPLNQEIWYCNDFNDIHLVDGVEYVRVFRKDTPNRTNLMRKSALQKAV